ncbi:putative Thiopurine S-methyltransferase [Vibrio nigripulchritudo MADA3029]|uniref:Thiopurine S-methyltransferase n=1 Tax=Vibrio nigripulchritudo SOn1 TaxID=1238450 RepID=A0AAV2VIM4_9VIBR|nr:MULTISPECIES: thiopurine S-methyltransferase [Vibrio]KJY79764.1 thiopurine S-methyltransferase [Vibrio nigripulchritudo]UAB71844.1 thiopurine S-methyltransferase [Vibrio sp. SCSIO 43132]CCN45702.1 putative Thiopurine S-methyltransferase [Vibrio nigripulchritudo MADA3020]CCN52955.1 putative Thiopurine S-methyltransferase [Vibrio nigripulchritudo MADA3021]CCN61609.1 putative Thiopurine S-methyltransferase [Vibrio nigripulchritudo MADA3029]
MQDQEIWHQKWASNQIGFHLEDVNPLLIKYWEKLSPSREQKVFVPLCGKSEDLVWLAQKHDNVQGVELSDIAVRAFFAEHFYTPTVTTVSSQHDWYQFDELNIYTGDYFTAPIEPVELIYDRAALIALPKDLRSSYVERLKSLLLPGGKILLVTLDYPQEEMAGPPFSVPKDEVLSLFDGFKVTHLARDDADETHHRIKKGLSRFAEETWLIE